MSFPDYSVESVRKLKKMLMEDFKFSRSETSIFVKDINARLKWKNSSKKFIKSGTFAVAGGVKDVRGKPCKRPGVYKYVYKPTGECVYIGYSNDLYRRTGKGKEVAKTLLSTGKQPSQTIYCAIPKMMEKDSNLQNWCVYYVEAPSKHIAKEFEDQLIKATNPIFNSNAST